MSGRSVLGLGFRDVVVSLVGEAPVDVDHTSACIGEIVEQSFSEIQSVWVVPSASDALMK